MEVTVNKNNSINSNNYHRNVTQKNDTNFTSTLNSVLNNCESTKESNDDKDTVKISEDILKGKTGIPTLDSLSKKNKLDVELIMESLSKRFHINPFDYFKDDSTIDMRKMLIDIGQKKISPYNLDFLQTTINTFYKNNLLDDDNYFYAAKWIQLKKDAIKVKQKNESMQNSVLNSLVDTKNHKSKIFNNNIKKSN